MDSRQRGEVAGAGVSSFPEAEFFIDRVVVKKRRSGVKLKSDWDNRNRNKRTCNSQGVLCASEEGRNVEKRGRRLFELSSPAVILGSLIVTWTCLVTLTQAQNVFSNQFAVHIPAGDGKAQEVAGKYGYNNLGQVRMEFY
jgi:hypothetical protein